VIVGAVVDLADAGPGLPPGSLLSLAALALAIEPLRAIGDAAGRALVPVLVATARLQLAFGALLAIGLWLERP
jgi:1,4-dihydroxy-2-naphthoate octaprenyltransferase